MMIWIGAMGMLLPKALFDLVVLPTGEEALTECCVFTIRLPARRQERTTVVFILKGFAVIQRVNDQKFVFIFYVDIF